MEFTPETLTPPALVGLALLDGTSIGTLVVPLILLVSGTGGARRVVRGTLLYLGVIGVFYLALGVLLLAGLLPLAQSLRGLLTGTVGTVLIAVVGAALLWASFRTDPKAVRRRGGDPEASARRWTERAGRALGSPRALVGLALLAGAVEAASMLPYLAAMGILAEQEVGLGVGALVLTGYCLLMIAPALVLCGIRLLLGSRADRTLERVHTWAVGSSASALSWALGIIGVILLLQTVGPIIGALAR
ncbi:GAP family protein [Brachybacterium sp. NBEC-018]|uniref:GAP family protein n=1 Tax=Brachybacterium sp. NBEC-018 TaxID=2996004 RepID=UPI0021755BFF|nr:GAP family protein [Brachybacterium sp. NBEC-018]UVY84024.1 GAP family protein [Brachybacterium sp. NBEC-018]